VCGGDEPLDQYQRAINDLVELVLLELQCEKM
jgi:hypothetical protein